MAKYSWIVSPSPLYRLKVLQDSILRRFLKITAPKLRQESHSPFMISKKMKG